MTTSSSTGLDGLPYLFDRRRSEHVWLKALDELRRSDVLGHSAVAENWHMDPRVDTKREQSLMDSGCYPATGRSPAFDRAIQDYFTHFQCLAPLAPNYPGYFEEANVANLIPLEERPARNHRLLHFASVNRLLGRILRGDNPRLADFQLELRRLIGARPPRSASGDEVSALVVTLQEQGVDVVKQFARAVSDALGDREPLWWAAFGHEIGDLSGKTDWTFAAQLTGLGHLDTGEWMLAWRYSPEIAGRLYRPTVAEANCNGFHFPSPPLMPYGIAMPMAVGQPAVRELVHPPLKGDACAEGCIGVFGRIETALADIAGYKRLNTWLAERRRSHSYFLSKTCPAAIPTALWLRRHGFAT